MMVTTTVPDGYSNKEKEIDLIPILTEFIDRNPTEVLRQIGIFISRQMWSRFLFFHHLYQQFVPVHGNIIEFGVRWGQNIVILNALRGIYEPFNHNRRIIGFDTFAGFPEVDKLDGEDGRVHAGGYGVWPGYEKTLEQVMQFHENQNPVSNIRKFELVKGDVFETLEPYLDKSKHMTVAMAYFDLDLYKPTKFCLEKILPFMGSGSVIGFDELNHPGFPGETMAMREVLGKDVKLCRVPYSPHTSYIVLP